MPDLIYQRILLKVSGEAFRGEKGFGIDPLAVESISKQIKEVRDLGCQIGIVVGGGNIFRGLSASENGMERVSADYMGMLATVMNSLALQASLEQAGCETRVQTSIEMRQVA